MSAIKHSRTASRLLPLACLLLIPTAAFAYVDPATGSLVIQVLVGGLLAALATAKLYWRKIRGLFGRADAGRVRGTSANRVE